MIKLYTDISKLPADKEWVMYNDAFFNTSIGIKQLTKEDFELMKRLEDISIYDKENSVLKSSSGIFHLKDISTGLKTLLNIRWLKRNKKKNIGVDITECGPIMLDNVFNEVADGSIPVLLRHTDVLELKDRAVLINDLKEVRTMGNLFSELIK